MPELVEAPSPPDDHEIPDVETTGRSPTEGPPAKKRKRTVKPNPDKKYDCKHEGCTKSYSRAEHLHRHQLNHTPKKIYRCDYPDCNRWFVRQDLCIRHRERHSTTGSQIYKRDTIISSSSPPNGMHALPEAIQPDRLVQQNISTNGEFYNGTGQPGPQFDRVYQNSSNSQHLHLPGSLSNSTASNELFKPPTPPTIRPTAALYRSGSISSNPFSPEHKETPMALNGQMRHDSFGSRTQESPGHGPYDSTFALQQPPQASRSYYPMRPGTNLSTHRNTVSSASNAAFAAAVSQGLSSVHTDPLVPYPVLGNDASMDSSIPFDYPIFGENEYTRSPFAMADDFTAWLFNENQSAMSFPTAPTRTFAYNEGFVPPFQGPGLATNSMRSPHPMKMTSILSPSASGQYVPIMSEDKRQELLHMMSTVFIERPHDAVKKRKDSVFEGDIDADGHILSLRMMHTYIGSYWYHQHAQMPILHKPTFSADKTPNLLLLIVIAIGAATMDKAYGTALTDSAAEFANFVVWHLRWEIVRDADFRPPAKLWVFQTLLLIEVYEKMYATRALHERAHIHHDSTLTLMRRGSSLLGRAASESPPGALEDKRKRSSGSVNETDKSEEQWYQWITTEATRRAAFGAFVLDSIHATMFGHSAKMVAHEMRLPLPCDEGLWCACSPAEAGRVQTALETNGVKPMLFLEGLKKTFLGDRVRTNSFGRTILMAGLLSVSWHMTQRDLQITSLGTKAAGDNFGRRDIWKGPLLRAFDNWKVEFDRALAEALPSTPDQQRVQNSGSVSMLRPVDDENIFESRTVLHHLAHIAAHVDILDCQVFAGATRLLGRSVSPKDYTMVREKIKKWASKASARDAAFYALKFLAQVLIPPDDEDGNNSIRYGHASPILPQAFEGNQYIARDDFLLNRPWVLFISTLVVWCYGFALEGPLIPRPSEFDFTTYDSRDQDMRSYLDRVGGINAPDDLEQVQGKNQCLGLLMILKDSFSLTRWELTHEAANLLGNCIERLKGVEGDGVHTGGQIAPKHPYKMENGRHARVGNGGV
jgi:Fungal specific transcription factor domain